MSGTESNFQDFIKFIDNLKRELLGIVEIEGIQDILRSLELNKKILESYYFVEKFDCLRNKNNSLSYRIYEKNYKKAMELISDNDLRRECLELYKVVQEARKSEIEVRKVTGSIKEVSLNLLLGNLSTVNPCKKDNSGLLVTVNTFRNVAGLVLIPVSILNLIIDFLKDVKEYKDNRGLKKIKNNHKEFADFIY